jgi:hypothetical protein
MVAVEEVVLAVLAVTEQQIRVDHQGKQVVLVVQDYHHHTLALLHSMLVAVVVEAQELYEHLVEVVLVV